MSRKPKKLDPALVNAVNEMLIDDEIIHDWLVDDRNPDEIDIYFIKKSLLKGGRRGAAGRQVGAYGRLLRFRRQQGQWVLCGGGGWSS